MASIEKGIFFAFEGIDQAGKDTQAENLRTNLEGAGYQTFLTHEPTDGVVGREIRLILTGKKPSPGPMELQNLFVEDRKEHQKEIGLAIKNRKVVICVRYWFSTVAYGASEGLAMRELVDINKHFLMPDLVIFLDIPTEVAIERMILSGKKLEYFEKVEKLEKVRTVYEDLGKEVNNWVIFNANKPVGVLSNEIIHKLKQDLDLRLKGG